jgi:UDP-glucose 4-epimerase
VRRLLRRNPIDAIIHFAGSIVVPESVADPLGYYLNNTCKSRSLLAVAVETKIPHFIFSSTAAVYGIAKVSPVTEDVELTPISPYGSSKLMTEIMLRDTAKAHPLRYVALRYFNVSGADPKGRSGQSTPHATHLIKVASQAALGERPISRCSARTIRLRTELASATIFMSPISSELISMRCVIYARAARARC